MCLVLWAVVSVFGTVSQTASGWTDEDRAIVLRGVEVMEQEQFEDVGSQIESIRLRPEFAGEDIQAAFDKITSLLEQK